MSLNFRKAAAFLCAVATLASNVTAAHAFSLQMPTRLPTARPHQKPRVTPDLLIVIPNKGLQDSDMKEAMDEVHGTVIGSLGQGDLKCYIVKTEKGRMEETAFSLFAIACTSYK